MLLFAIPSLLLAVPTLLQAFFTFHRLHYHTKGYLWTIFFLSMPLQVVFGVIAMLVSMRGIVQNGVQCAIGAGVFFAGGIVLALTITPTLAVLAALFRWLNHRLSYPVHTASIERSR